ncbi:MAG: hypothetical protein ACYS26_11360, partial [Planctomycetota bacterium]
MWPLLHAIQLTCLVLLLGWGLHRLVLLLGYWKLASKRRGRDVAATDPEPRPWPRVLVQLPLYNERDVAARAIRAVGALDYPR